MCYPVNPTIHEVSKHYELSSALYVYALYAVRKVFIRQKLRQTVISNRKLICLQKVCS